jgi:hypothetical protein
VRHYLLEQVTGSAVVLQVQAIGREVDRQDRPRLYPLHALDNERECVVSSPGERPCPREHVTEIETLERIVAGERRGSLDCLQRGRNF